jgi:hypothetical protein
VVFGFTQEDVEVGAGGALDEKPDDVLDIGRHDEQRLGIDSPTG